jgi:predicted nuclease with TOPRIM domain
LSPFPLLPQYLRLLTRNKAVRNQKYRSQQRRMLITDKVKTQAYCDLTKLEGQVKAAEQKNDTKTLEALNRQAESLLDKLGPEYFKLMDGLEEVDPKSSEAKEFMSILSELDKPCAK